MLLYLLVTMLPFAVVAPVLGPALDYRRSGRRVLVVTSMMGRAVLALMMARWISDAAPGGLLVYPIAFGILVLAKGYSVAKSALVPALVDDPGELVRANSRLALVSVIATTVGGVPAFLVQEVFGPEWSLRFAFVVFVIGGILALKIPQVRIQQTAQQAELEREELHQPSILLAGSAMAVIRGAVGFLAFFAAFSLKSDLFALGVAASMAVAGGFVGNIAGPAVRRVLREEQMLAASLLVTGSIVLVGNLLSERSLVRAGELGGGGRRGDGPARVRQPPPTRTARTRRAGERSPGSKPDFRWPGSSARSWASSRRTRSSGCSSWRSRLRSAACCTSRRAAPRAVARCARRCARQPSTGRSATRPPVFASASRDRRHRNRTKPLDIRPTRREPVHRREPAPDGPILPTRSPEAATPYAWRSLPPAGRAADHAEGPGRPAEAVGHELVDLLAGGDALVDDAARFADHGEVDAVRDEAPARRRVVDDDRVLPAPRGELARSWRWFPSLVSGVRTISASRITGAGDAQCQPITRSGRSVAAASAAIGKPDVFDARIVAGGATRSRSRNTRTFSSSRSGMASITTSTAAASSNELVNVRRAERGVGVGARQLVALDRAVEAEATGRDVLARAVERAGVDVVADGRSSRRSR